MENILYLKKYAPACIFCGQAKDVVSFKGKNICPACMEELKKIILNARLLRRVFLCFIYLCSPYILNFFWDFSQFRYFFLLHPF